MELLVLVRVEVYIKYGFTEKKGCSFNVCVLNYEDFWGHFEERKDHRCHQN